MSAARAVRIRSRPEDFVVEEIPLYPAAGEGDHTFVHIEKRLRTTEEVAHSLARVAGVRSRDIGYAGRKDRVAVARQWLSVPGLGLDFARALVLPGVRVLEAHAHPHKLRTGHLLANRFEIVVRDVDAVTLGCARERAAELYRRGMPNRFGAQRFGREGRGAEQGLELLLASDAAASGRRNRHDRREDRFLLSAFQAEIFNRALAARPVDLDGLERGDVCVVHASGGLFVVEDPDAEAARARGFEISATGPIVGSRMRRAEGAVGVREADLFRSAGLPPLDVLTPPKGLRMRGGRRTLRTRPRALGLEDLGGDRVRLSFELDSGSYATVLVEELFGEFCEGADPGVVS